MKTMIPFSSGLCLLCFLLTPPSSADQYALRGSRTALLADLDCSAITPSCTRRTKKSGACICPLNFEPVCGCDGAKYGNACKAACAGVDVEHPCLKIDCLPGFTIVDADNLGCGGECVEEPCLIVDCRSGFITINTDSRGCGGECIEEKPCTRCF